jgi:hypothetical protein
MHSRAFKDKSLVHLRRKGRKSAEKVKSTEHMVLDAIP